MIKRCLAMFARSSNELLSQKHDELHRCKSKPDKKLSQPTDSYRFREHIRAGNCTLHSSPTTARAGCNSFSNLEAVISFL
jgi:hypothetical protein